MSFGRYRKYGLPKSYGNMGSVGADIRNFVKDGCFVSHDKSGNSPTNSTDISGDVSFEIEFQPVGQYDVDSIAAKALRFCEIEEEMFRLAREKSGLKSSLVKLLSNGDAICCPDGTVIIASKPANNPNEISLRKARVFK